MVRLARPATRDAHHPVVRIGDATIEVTQDFDDSPGSHGSNVFGGTLDATTLSLVVTRRDARYDAEHNVTETRYLYDMLGRLVDRRVPGYSASSPEAFRWTYDYDGSGPLEKWMDGNGHTVYLDRNDPLKRVTKRYVVPKSMGQVIALNTGYEQWLYDDDERKVTRRTWAGDWKSGAPDWRVDVVRSYDSFARLLSEAFGFGEGAAGGHQSQRGRRPIYSRASSTLAAWM